MNLRDVTLRLEIAGRTHAYQYAAQPAEGAYTADPVRSGAFQPGQPVLEARALAYLTVPLRADGLDSARPPAITQSQGSGALKDVFPVDPSLVQQALGPGPLGTVALFP